MNYPFKTIISYEGLPESELMIAVSIFIAPIFIYVCQSSHSHLMLTVHLQKQNFDVHQIKEKHLMHYRPTVKNLPRLWLHNGVKCDI